MPEFHVVISDEVHDTIDADTFKVEGTVAVFYDALGLPVGAINLNEGILIRKAGHEPRRRPSETF